MVAFFEHDHGCLKVVAFCSGHRNEVQGVATRRVSKQSGDLGTILRRLFTYIPLLGSIPKVCKLNIRRTLMYPFHRGIGCGTCGR